mgnify:CR=1 FL=1
MAKQIVNVNIAEVLEKRVEAWRDTGWYVGGWRDTGRCVGSVERYREVCRERGEMWRCIDVDMGRGMGRFGNGWVGIDRCVGGGKANVDRETLTI